MPTLKQIIKEKFSEYIIGYAYDLTEKQLNHISKVVIEGFKEWLQRKRQERVNRIVKRKKNILSLEERVIIDDFFDELLEELC